MSNKKATQSFDHYITNFCIACLAGLSIGLIVERANSCPAPATPLTTDQQATLAADEAVRAKFYQCIVDPSCKAGGIKLRAIRKDAKRKLIAPMSK